MIHEDEVSFRQDSTLYRTWSRLGHQPSVPVTGERKGVKVFGSIEIFSARFLYQMTDVFNAETYLDYLYRIAKSYFPRKTFLIHDNASYHHKETVKSWFRENKKWLSVFHFPAYCPELNAAERLWHHTRVSGTHNRYFSSIHELDGTVRRIFKSMQRSPQQIRGYLQPFC